MADTSHALLLGESRSCKEGKHKEMIVIAVTGGAACGKSQFCQRFVEMMPPDRCEWFSSDRAVSELLEEKRIKEGIKFLGTEFNLFQGGELNRDVLRKQVFENSEFREKLQLLLHPRVLERAEAILGQRKGDRCIVLLEVPLLYEVEFPVSRNLDLTVAASRVTQINRITEKRKLTSELAGQILDSQLPIETKISRSDLVVWNDGSEDLFQAQIQQLADRCQPYVSE